MVEYLPTACTLGLIPLPYTLENGLCGRTKRCVYARRNILVCLVKEADTQHTAHRGVTPVTGGSSNRQTYEHGRGGAEHG